MNYLPRSRIPGDPNGASSACRAALLSSLATAVLPQACALCGGWAGRWPVCSACVATLPHLPLACCPQCSDRSAAGVFCSRCLRSAPAFERTVAALVYAPPVDHLIHALKYAHHLHLAHWLGVRLADAWQGGGADLPDPARSVVIAMPLDAGRLAERGFNQATEIARSFARRLGARLRHDVCVRVRPTAPQARLALEARPANVRNAFACSEDLQGRDVVLVDDVMTSGASLGELARVVRLHGAGRVIAAVAARTLHD